MSLTLMHYFEKGYFVLNRPEECRLGDSGVSKLLPRANCLVKTFVVVDKLRTEDGLPPWTEPGVVDVVDDLDQR
jgi:hypothetical protein